MPYIKLRGANHYYQWIPEYSGNKPVMVFLHGWAGSARYWESTAQALAEEFDCLLYDMRGFGRSHLLIETELQLDYELETYADDLAQILDALNLNKVYLNAHSMGASVAVFFINKYPQKVEKAIFTCSGVFEYDEKAFTAFHKFGGYVVKYRPKWLAKIPFADQMFMARFLHRRIPQPLRVAFLEDFIHADYNAALNTIFTSVSERMAMVMPGEFAKLQVPVLLVAGQYDKIIPAKLGQVAAQQSQKVKYWEMAKTAHFPMLEDAETYLKGIKEYLQE